MVSSTDIAQHIIEAVLAQRLAPGTRLGEQNLSMLFDCSRTLVREALVRPALTSQIIIVAGYVQLFQGTPLLMQLFLAYFGLALFGINVPAWVAAALALTLYTSAFLAEIWRGCVNAVPRGQWEAAASLAMSFGETMRHVVGPQALRIAVPPTVGFLVQVIKGTALASVIGFVELTKAGTMITNATFQPFLVYSCVAMMYFALCFPVSLTARSLERKMHVYR